MSGEIKSVYSVTELVQSARTLLENKFSSILVQGESGRFTKHPSGHMYFDLKDDKCLVSCAFFKNANQALAFQPEQGMHVIVGGTPTLYEARGQFQLSVRSMEPKGVGGLQVALAADFGISSTEDEVDAVGVQFALSTLGAPRKDGSCAGGVRA